MRLFHLSLGANLGAREASLAQAVRRIANAGLAIDRVSSLYETEPVGDLAGPRWFLNLAVSGRTALPAREIVGVGLEIERAMGRARDAAGGARSIDIDLLLLEELIVREAGCEVPHPRMHERRFVLDPLAEIAPEARHPVLAMTVRELQERLQDPACVLKRGPLIVHGGSHASHRPLRAGV